jgi:fatty-acyl-CoA synthase
MGIRLLSGEKETYELDWLKQWARYSPLANAFKDSESGVGYSYSSLYFLSCRLALHLRERFGISPGSRIAILATNELEHLPLFFAVQRLGAILVPINFRLAGREIAHILADSAPELLVAQEQFASAISAAGAAVVPDKCWSFEGHDGLSEIITQELATFDESAGSGQVDFIGGVDSPCMLLYTSGTTGAPKGAIVTNKMLHWNSLNTQLRLNLSQSDVTIAFAPFFHTGGWNVLLTPYLHRGASTILLRKFDAGRVLELCQQEKVTMLFGVPTMLDMMARTPQFETVDLSSLRFAIVGGEPMPIELIKTWGAKGVPIRQGFGLTEFGPNVFSLNEEDALRKIGSIGFPNFYIQARVVDAEDHDVANGEIGELVLRGPVCTPGYWNNAKATIEAIRDGWLHTGDLVRQDSEGYFYVAGRKKDMFISGGENVYPVEIERFLSTHPAIREVAVIGVPDPKWGEVGKACVVLKGGARVTAFEVLGFCDGNLAKFKIPKHVEFMPELPKNDSGKVLKRTLRLSSQIDPLSAQN